MSKYQLTYKPYGETSILIEWPSKIDPDIIKDITLFDEVIRKESKVIETIVAYNSILVHLKNYKNYSENHTSKKYFKLFTEHFQNLYQQERNLTDGKQKCWQIPVCYDLEFGIDLEEMSQIKNLSIKEIIRIHSKTEYLIYFLGFQPGFLYLGGLDPELHTPRRANPRLRIEKGSIGIGGEQTGIYPQDSAGGWNIIGSSPINLFDPSKNQPCFARAGEYVKFVSIGKDEYLKLQREVRENKYQPNYSWI